MIAPFKLAVSDTDLEDLNRRLRDTRWTDDFANNDWSYGAEVRYIRSLADYWRDEYNWRAREAQINRLPQYVTEIDGLPIHFAHVPGTGPAPIPLILSHGWPWTFLDFAKVIGPLTDPAAHGGDPGDAFHVVVPSLPGYGFSTPLRTPGINWWKTADLWVVLMERLGYPRFGAHGGDWGSFISAQLGHKHAERTIGVHLHTPGRLDFMEGRGFAPDDYAPDEAEVPVRAAAFQRAELGYFALQTTKPQTPAVALSDSPAGLLAWIVEKRRRWSDCGGDVERRFTRDELLDTVMIYWITRSYHSSARFYAEGARQPWRPSHDRTPCVEAPVAIPLMPGELTRPPRAWAERYYNLERWTEMPAGGHFAAAEEPAAIVDDLRAFFRDKR